jgi:tetratricopeptide (TPR) repeat protein
MSVYMCQNLRETGHPTEALAFGQNAQAIAESLADVPLQVTGNLYLGVACYGTGDYRRAEDLFLKVLRLLEGDRSRQRFGLAGFPAVLVHSYLLWVLAERGKFEEGIGHGQEGLRLAETLDHPYSLANHCTTLAALHITRGEHTHALRLSERGLALSREWNLTILSVLNTGRLGYTNVLSGQTTEGVALLEHALSDIETMGLGNFQPLFLVHLGEAYVLAGRREDALELARRALTLARERGQRPNEAKALRLFGEIASHRDSPEVETAEDCYRQAFALADELGMRPLLAHCHRGLAELYRRAGKHEQARDHLITATTMYREMEMGFWLERTAAEIGALA